MFVFDVGDTEPEDGAPPLPPEVEHPFAVRCGHIGSEQRRTIENAKRDGVAVTERDESSQSAGKIRVADPGRHLQVLVKSKPKPEYVLLKLRYDILLNAKLSPEGRYATLVHELAHLYCGHLGTPNEKWWPDRRGRPHDVREFEAESVCYLLCRRLGIDNPSDEYLAAYLRGRGETPEISLDCVVRTAGLIEQMGRVRLPLRKENA